MLDARDPSDQKPRWPRTRFTTLVLWVLVAVLALGGTGYVIIQGLTGGAPGQYVYLLRQKRRVAIPASYEPLTWADFLALPTLPKAYGAPEWATVTAYSARGVSLAGYIAETLRRHCQVNGQSGSTAMLRGTLRLFRGHFFTPKWDDSASEPEEIPAEWKVFFRSAVNLTMPWYTRDHLSAISAISPAGKLSFRS